MVSGMSSPTCKPAGIDVSIARLPRLRQISARFDELRLCRNVEQRSDYFGIEDRNPAHADALGARREPNRMHGGDCRILDHFRHGEAAEAVTLFGRAIGEHRQVAWRLLQSGKLETGIERRSLGALRR